MGRSVLVNPWFFASLLSFAIIESISFSLWDTLGRATTIITLLFTSLFFGFFFIFFLSSAFGANTNEWVKDVERMEGPCFNPMYTVWLYENKQREWAALGTIISVIFTFVFGSLLLYGEFTGESFLSGYIIGLAFIALVAVSWFEGYWKPRTRKSPIKIPESVEAEWADKRI